jgi:hypothetical protein
MQGGESPVVVIICHDAHKAMLYREWLYTAITRASQKCILMFTPTALKTALNKQSIKGQSLKEKVASFNAIIGPANVSLPESTSTRNMIMLMDEKKYDTGGRFLPTSVKEGGLAKLIQKSKEREASVRVEIHVKYVYTFEGLREIEPESPEYADYVELDQKQLAAPTSREVVAISDPWTVYQAGRPSPLALPKPAPKPVNKLALKLGRIGK